MALKINGPSLPTFQVVPPAPQLNTPRPGYNVNGSSFSPATVPPVVLQPPQRQFSPAEFLGFDDTKRNSALKLNDKGEVKSAKYCFAQAVMKHGQPANEAEAQAWWEGSIRPEMEAQGFKCGPLMNDRGHFSAVICTRENPEGEAVTIFRTDGVGSGSPKCVWECQGGDPGAVDSFFGEGMPYGLNSTFDALLRAWSGKSGWKAGASPEDRRQAVEGMRQDLIKQAAAKGIELSADPSSPDKVLVKNADGTRSSVQFVDAAAGRDLSLVWRPQ